MNENIEKVKSQYDEEVKRLQRLAAATQQKYQNEFNRLKEVEQNLLNEYNAEIQKITIGIERLRGAYTALCDFEEGKAPTLVENGMMKDVEIPEIVEEPAEEKADEPVEEKQEEQAEESNEISEEIKAKAKEVVKKAKEAGKVTPYEEFAESDLGKETAVKDVKEMVADENKIENAQLHQSGEAILSEEEVEALKAVTDQITTKDNTPKETENAEVKVKPEDVPDYLKDQYNLK